MKRTRCFICLLLALAIAAVFPMTASAASLSKSSDPLDDVIGQIQAAFPTATISVEDGTINVLVPESSNQGNNDTRIPGQSTRASETTIVAPEGGIWSNFRNPWYTYINPDSHVLPYSMVYLPADRAQDLYLAMTTTGLWDFILDNPLTAAGTEAIAASILARFGIAFETTSIFFLYSAAMIYLYDTVNTNSFANAIRGGSGAVRIDYTTLGGWPVNYYYAWGGTTVTNSPWQDFNPVFYRGVYNLADL